MASQGYKYLKELAQAEAREQVRQEVRQEGQQKLLLTLLEDRLPYESQELATALRSETSEQVLVEVGHMLGAKAISAVGAVGGIGTLDDLRARIDTPKR